MRTRLEDRAFPLPAAGWRRIVRREERKVAPPRVRRTAATAIVAMTLVGCGGGGAAESAGDGPSPRPAAAAETTVEVTLGNFFVTADPASVPPGTVTFDITVETSVEARIHALTVLRTDLPPDGLPTFVEGNADTSDEAIEIIYSEGPTEKDHQAEVELDAGSYVLICNLADHYGKGMRTGFEVA